MPREHPAARSPRAAPLGGRPRRRRALAGALAATLAAGCAARTLPPPAPAAAPALAATLVGLGREALATGDAEQASERFERALAADPASPEARGGLARALIAAGHFERARAVLQDGSADAAPLCLARAALAAHDGDAARARTELERALALDPERLEAHLQLAALTGRAPATPPAGDDEAIARGARYPYDPRARFAAGIARLDRGDVDGARDELESALVVADLDPPSALRAAALLRARVPEWRERRVVFVHVLADEVLRADPAWRFQLRFAWLAVSKALDPLLGVRFVVADFDGFRSASAAGVDLPPIEAAARAQHPALPAAGIVCIVTGRPLPRAPGVWKQGQAELLGRVLTVRLARGEIRSRVLVHEVVHLFGGVHVNPEVASLMNPSGHSLVLDPWNAAILRATRSRAFGPGGIEANVLDRVDRQATIAAYQRALAVNVRLRNAGVAEALEASGGSVRGAAPELRAAVQLDAQLGDVASFLAELLRREHQPARAAMLWDAAARLYGPSTRRGRVAARRAHALAAQAER